MENKPETDRKSFPMWVMLLRKVTPETNRGVVVVTD